ncbi:CG4542 [Drosophila busckii]|uniref:Alpha-1,3-glucosyltransferase n=1 Tax=Drosophila busckii TaxID=30019 RepID=A0A0M4FA52_DROBS|nr:CG4542 [Drosophila busckii]
MSGYFWQLVGISSAFKVLLMPAYYSTDFEVHRNWLAITHSLPLNRWYIDTTSQWTLDYPPFFAYFEWLLSQVAKYVDPKMLIVQNLNYESQTTVYFQRGSIIVMDGIYVLGMRCALSALGVQKSTQQHIAGCMLMLFNVGLIFVDHIHFQYNGFLFGLLLLSISAILRKRYLWSAFIFAALLNFKHIFLYMAPAFAVYLLRFYCLEQRSLQQKAQAMLRLLAVGLTPFVLSFGPFWQQLPQLMSRLFPFKRGLTHAYWAPNVWALYNTADKIAAGILGRTPATPRAASTSGLVQDVEHLVLPRITPAMTFALTLASMLPILLKLYFTKSRDKAHLVFLRAIVLCACSAFMFGWHVHEKAILMCLIPFLLTVLKLEDAKYAYILGIAGYFSLFPLLFEVDLLVPRYTLYLGYMAMLYGQLQRIYKTAPHFHPLEWAYFLVFIAIPIYEHIISRLLGYHIRYPFLPLLLTSVYCALGVLYFFVRYYVYALDISWTKRSAAPKRSKRSNRKIKTK